MFLSSQPELISEEIGKQSFASSIVLAKVCKALRDQTATNFVKSIFSSHYLNYFSKEYTNSILSKSFDELAKYQQEKIRISQLRESLNTISTRLYNKSTNPKFYEAYSKYKSIDKPKYYYDLVKNHLHGETILDFGSGKGYFSDYLFSQGFKVKSADVLNYTEVDSSKIPFVQLTSVTDISNKISNIDTTVIITVLHHISNDAITLILQELAKISKRIIIIEDIYDIESYDKLVGNALCEELKNLSLESRINAINLTDFFGNVVTQGLAGMNLPFEFKTMPAWIQLLEKSEFNVLSCEPIGFPKVSFHGFYQAMLVCESKKYQE